MIKLPSISIKPLTDKVWSGRFIWVVLAGYVFVDACHDVAFTPEQAFAVVIVVVNAYFNRNRNNGNQAQN
jgi:hypothetical protein